MDATKVSTGKPQITGCIYRAPIGTTVPTDARTALSSAFKELGYVSDDGLTNSYKMSSEAIKAWGGVEVNSQQTDKTDGFKFKLIEVLNTEVLKTVYGESHVEESQGDIAVHVTYEEAVDYVWVVEMLVKGNRKKRIVIPDAKITEIGDIVYKDNEVTGFDLSITAFPDSDGFTHHEYIAAAGE